MSDLETIADFLHDRVDYSHPDPGSGKCQICLDNARDLLHELELTRALDCGWKGEAGEREY